LVPEQSAEHRISDQETTEEVVFHANAPHSSLTVPCRCLCSQSTWIKWHG